MADKIYPLVCEPGIQKDGTEFASRKWTDGLWMRFQRGLPEAIGGWRRLKPVFSWLSGVYHPESKDYTVGQLKKTRPDVKVNFRWNPYLEYQPRSIIVGSQRKDEYFMVIGCIEEFKWDPPFFASALTSECEIPAGWKSPLPSDSALPDSSAVTFSVLNNEGTMQFICNSWAVDYSVFPFPFLYFQLQLNLGPVTAYYTEKMQWTFEKAYCSFMYALGFTSDSIATYKKIKLTQGSNCLFGIALYNLDSIQNTCTVDGFSVKATSNMGGSASTKVVTINYLKVFPVVHVTSLGGETQFSSIEEPDDKNNYYAERMVQLSHSGYPDGAGKGAGINTDDGKDYGRDFIAPTFTTKGSTGIGCYYFPQAFYISGSVETQSTGYIWSSDCVFCSGGVLNMAPYVFFYNYHPWDWQNSQPSSTNGYIAFTYENMDIWTTDAVPVKKTSNDCKMPRAGVGLIPEEGATTIIQDFVQVASTNIVYGAQIRGGSNPPTALFWSLDTLIKCAYVGGTVKFQFDTIAGNLSILSSRCVVEISGIFYWIGIDQFYMYTGVVQTLVNETNINYFFRNLDKDNAQKVWGVKVGQYNEIWWHYPNKNLPDYTGECNAVLIYNYKPGQECWYDSAFPVTSNLPRAGRVAGSEISIFPYPLWIDAYKQKDFTPNSTATGEYWFTWIHENTADMTAPGLWTGKDETKQYFLLPDERFSIPTSLTSRILSLPAIGPDNNWSGADRWLRLTRIEPDMVQLCDMEFQLIGKKYTSDYDTVLGTYNLWKDDLQGVCLTQALPLSIDGGNIDIAINGKYADKSKNIATFPYPRKITATNYSCYWNGSTADFNNVLIDVEIFGTYQGIAMNETIKLLSNTKEGGFNSQEGKLLFDSVSKVTAIFSKSIDITENVCSLVSVGTKIPIGIEEGSVESQRLLNFYTDINKQVRILKIKFEQNELGSDFQLGQFLMHFDIGDGRQ